LIHNGHHQLAAAFFEIRIKQDSDFISILIEHPWCKFDILYTAAMIFCLKFA